MAAIRLGRLLYALRVELRRSVWSVCGGARVVERVWWSACGGAHVVERVWWSALGCYSGVVSAGMELMSKLQRIIRLSLVLRPLIRKQYSAWCLPG